MAFRFHHSSNFTKMLIIGEFLVVSYLLYTLTVSVYKSYQIDQHILNFKKDNERISSENKQKEQDYSYYSSSAYIEKIAKQDLGLVNPGEEVIIIPKENSGQQSLDGLNNEDDDGVDFKPLSNTQKWWRFFFQASR